MELIIWTAVARSEARDAMGSWKDEAAVIVHAPELRVSRDSVEALRDGGNPEQLRLRKVREYPGEKFVGQR
jgi:hypothetical protein